ncbi:hypothetical protein B0H17DRAFT_951226, partial [Mycena rosella]
RVCPGIHLAHNSININAITHVWAFNFARDTDAGGNPINPDTWDYLKVVLTAPCPYKWAITPRTAETVEIIERDFLEAANTFSKFEVRLSPEGEPMGTRELFDGM